MLRSMLLFALFLMGCGDTPEQLTWQPYTNTIERDAILASVDQITGLDLLQSVYVHSNARVEVAYHHLDANQKPEMFLRITHPEICQMDVYCPHLMLMPVGDTYELSNLFFAKTVVLSETYNEKISFIAQEFSGKTLYRWADSQFGFHYYGETLGAK